MIARLFTFIVALAVAGGAYAQEKKRIDKAADMPRFTYKVDGKLDEVVRDDAKFKAFAATGHRLEFVTSARRGRPTRTPVRREDSPCIADC